MISRILSLILFYIRLIKVPQTGLLLFTAFAGYRSSGESFDPFLLILAAAGMLLVISGTTALNMVFDRDIDNLMKRTQNRPIPLKKISYRSAAIFGSILVVIGFVLNFLVSFQYMLIVALGMFFDLVIYTIWLKRRSPFSIIFGGLAGGMPILAGRVMVIGNVDLVGVLLAVAILFWIPTHILTLAMNHSDDYRLAGVPTFPNVFGFTNARFFITLSNLIAAGTFLAVFILLDMPQIAIYMCIAGSALLLLITIRVLVVPSEKTYFLMFKFASIYMAGIMLILVIH